MPKRWQILPLSLFLWLATSTASVAEASSDIIAQWNGLVSIATTALRDGNYAKAQRVAAGLLLDMGERLGPTDEAPATLANVLALQSLSEHGLGKERDAVWHWQTAMALDPSVNTRDFSKYGDLAKFFADHPNLNPIFYPEVHTVKNNPQIQPPVPRKRPRPVYPRAAHYFGVHGSLHVAAVIDKDGLVQHPQIFKPLPAATLTAAALEALKDWRFKPATLNGKPVAVLFMLTVDYKP